MAKHKSEDYKISAVQYYLTKNKNQLQTCKIFKCHPRSLMRWVDRYNKNKEFLEIYYNEKNKYTQVKIMYMPNNYFTYIFI